MSWMLVTLLVVLALAVAASWHRRVDLRRQQRALADRAAAAARSATAAPVELPHIDLDRCLGCGTCVRACPEDGVLQLVHGQAAVVDPGSCVGHARCVAECPVGAVALVAADATSRDDVPALDPSLQAIGTDGLYLVGEITARSLIRNATAQGARVAATIAERLADRSRDDGVHDVVIVGAGPGGFACALGCTGRGLDFVLIDQEPVVGGTVARYPRKKLVLTEPIELPLHGRLPRREYSKEELIELWGRLAREHHLPFRGNVVFDRCERLADGTFLVHTDQGVLRARTVVLAVGRRGVPRRLGVPGEELPHVTFSLLDAAAYQGRHTVVVGGGDSAVETALALAEQPDNTVALVYRQPQFFRIRSRNRERLDAAVAAGRVETLLGTDVVEIGDGSIELVQRGGEAGGGTALQLRADDVFVMAGGDPPFQQLARSGVSFDPADRPAPAPAPDPGARTRGLLPALLAAFGATVAATVFVLWHRDYYLLSPAARAADPQHALLRPDRSLGLWFGLFAAAAVLANLAYLLRRQQWLGVKFGSLSAWMTAHVGTGFLAVLLALLHAAMAPRQTAGGWAFWALVVLLATGAVGRWFYAWLPRSTNGRELQLDALRGQLADATAALGDGAFARAARAEVDALLARRQWRASWPGRVLALAGLQWDLWLVLRRLRREAAAASVPRDALALVLERTRTAHAAAVALAHLEDLRALMGTWRWLHRWLALFMVLILVVHVVSATLRGVFATGGLW